MQTDKCKFGYDKIFKRFLKFKTYKVIKGDNLYFTNKTLLNNFIQPSLYTLMEYFFNY